jgi:uncharacterized damage-inducible protein DinB
MEFVKNHLVKGVASAAKSYRQDFEALTHEQLAASPMGQARAPYDFTYEVVVVNKRIAARLRGEDPGAWTAEGWMTAPEELKDKAALMASFDASVDELTSAIQSIPAEEMGREIVLPNTTTNPLDLATHAVVHMTYHDAQLNYVQELHGDMAVHWD